MLHWMAVTITKNTLVINDSSLEGAAFPLTGEDELVAGAGFEPATSGL
jgi:hypothetical protein